ncbi:hypothetical protein THRCLA_22011 [Thraustotheca clavata]|uniref:Uncharacterized protein n=1 Tax=Thraustotheca clavata TaxID=74557 RepID=A0A1V9ZEB3_9STRA|nr:hypothetical protein THRCLA_22011 [Thraustotheca clavata]
MSTKLYDIDLAFGTTLGQSKAGRLTHKESDITHSMVFTGYNLKPEEEKPDKWRVENSWGTERSDNGFDPANRLQQRLLNLVYNKVNNTTQLYNI